MTTESPGLAADAENRKAQRKTNLTADERRWAQIKKVQFLICVHLRPSAVKIILPFICG
jgi:hypothetical protein